MNTYLELRLLVSLLGLATLLVNLLFLELQLPLQLQACFQKPLTHVLKEFAKLLPADLSLFFPPLLAVELAGLALASAASLHFRGTLRE